MPIDSKFITLPRCAPTTFERKWRNGDPGQANFFFKRGFWPGSAPGEGWWCSPDRRSRPGQNPLILRGSWPGSAQGWWGEARIGDPARAGRFFVFFVACAPRQCYVFSANIMFIRLIFCFPCQYFVYLTNIRFSLLIFCLPV